VSFVAAYQAVQGKAELNCSPQAMISSTAAGISVGVSAGFPGGVQASVNFSAGPLIAQAQKCDDMKQDIDSSAQQAVTAMWDAIANTMTEASKLTDASQAIQSASAQIAQLVNQTNIAAEQANLEETLTDAGLQTSFGLWRTLHNYDVQNAQSLLTAARLEALIARRAIESSYVVNLSAMRSPELTVAAPIEWADNIYTMDLDLAAAVGLTVGSTASTNIYPYTITDYVRNLNSFVTGFFNGARNGTVPRTEYDVINLAGPVTVDPWDSVAWTFFCPSSADGTQGAWVDVPAAADSTVWSARLTKACPNRVVRAKVRFSLDPWARLGMTALHALDMSKEYNTRWEKFAINLEGTSVCDVPPGSQGVPAANDPLCVTTNVVHTTFTQVAPAWTTDAQGVWTPLGFPTLGLGATPAMETGQVLQRDAWTNSTVSSWTAAVAERGFYNRPVGGIYEIEINPDNDPSVVLPHLDGVQILYVVDFWQAP
jgi:hypothetical protein